MKAENSPTAKKKCGRVNRMNKRYEEGRKPFFSESGEKLRKQYVWAKDKEEKEYLPKLESNHKIFGYK